MSVSPRDCELLGHRDQVPNHLTTLSVWAHLTLKHPSKVETHINFTFQIVKGKLREVYLRNLISERQSQDAQHLKQCLANVGVQWIFIRKNQHLHFSCIRPWWCSQLEGMNTLCSCFLYSNSDPIISAKFLLLSSSPSSCPNCKPKMTLLWQVRETLMISLYLKGVWGWDTIHF